MNDNDLLKKFGVGEAELDGLESEAAKGVLRGVPRKTVSAGRPCLFGERMQQVGFKEPLSKVAEIDARASQLGMRRSDYLRYLVDQDLSLAQGMQA